LADKSVLLFHTIPGFFSDNFGRVPNFLGEVSKVSVRGNEFLARIVFPVPGLAHDHDVVASSEGVSVERDWLQNNFTLVCYGLVGAAAVKVPLRDF
jgi:hypothetical protein